MGSALGWVTVVGEVASGVYDEAEQEEFERSGAEAYLVVPFFRFAGAPGSRRLVVGQAGVAATAEPKATVTVAVQGVWSEEGGWRQEPAGSAGFDEALLAELVRPGPAVGEDAAAVTVNLAKAIAEESRHQVLRLRGLRYETEQKIAALLAKRRNGALRPLLAEVIELSTAIGRARDQAQTAVREGLWIWLWDEDAYRRNRPDSDLPLDERPKWLAVHRAAIRHCSTMDVQLAEEVSRLHSMLSSMSAFAVAQDAEAQEQFNLLAALAAAGLGLPALILALYGADAFLPINSFDYAWRALVPIAIAVMLTTIIALRWLPGRSRLRRYALAISLTLGLVAVLLFAGVLAPGK